MEAVSTVAEGRRTLRYDDNGVPSPEMLAIGKDVAAALNMDFIEGPIVACLKCQHFACVCEILVTHKPDCKFLKAATCSIAIECEHGYDVCPECDPCTC